MKKAVIILIGLTLVFVSCKKTNDLTDEFPESNTSVVEQTDEIKDIQQDDIDSSVVDSDALGVQGDIAGDSLDTAALSETLEDVYFDFDKSSLSAASREVLGNHARWLKDNATVSIVIEGHCDERGTEQYNIALGDKRAHSVKNYLISMGVEAHRMRTQSYGETFPKINESNEWAWSQNRRAHFVLQKR